MTMPTRGSFIPFADHQSAWAAPRPQDRKQPVCPPTPFSLSAFEDPSDRGHFFHFTARFRPGKSVRQISHVRPSQPRAVQCSRP